MKTYVNINYPFILCLLAFMSCSRQSDIESTKQNQPVNFVQDTIGTIVFNIKDTTSKLYISYHECTECIDAYVDSGKLFIPEAVHQMIKEVETNRGAQYVPGGRDLYLTGPDKINETLFGDSLNYGEHWGDRFLITGKAVAIKGHGLIFQVDSYKKVNNECL